MMRWSAVLTSVLCALILGACSGSVEFSFGGQTAAEAAVDLIEGDAMAQRLGLDMLASASCDDPVDDNVGTVFMCTADSQGETVTFDVTIEDDDRIFAAPTNVVGREFLVDYERSAVAALNNENDFTFTDNAMDCGDQSVVLDADRQMWCALTFEETGTVYDAALTVRDTELGTFSVEIVDVAE